MWSIYFLIFLLNPANPIRPSPRSSMLAGSGAGVVGGLAVPRINCVISMPSPISVKATLVIGVSEVKPTKSVSIERRYIKAVNDAVESRSNCPPWIITGTIVKNLSLSLLLPSALLLRWTDQ